MSSEESEAERKSNLFDHLSYSRVRRLSVGPAAMASKAVVVGGIGAAVSCEDVLRVALGAPVALDAALMEKLERDAGCSKAPKVRRSGSSALQIH